MAHLPDLGAGTPVRAHRDGPVRGTWARYEGREGWVVTVNRQRLSNPPGTHVEVGVSWQPPSDTRNPAVDAWFAPGELVIVHL